MLILPLFDSGLKAPSDSRTTEGQARAIIEPMAGDRCPSPWRHRWTAFNCARAFSGVRCSASAMYRRNVSSSSRTSRGFLACGSGR